MSKANLQIANVAHDNALNLSKSGMVRYLAARLKHANTYRKQTPELKAHTLAFPEPRWRLAKELAKSNHLGNTPDGKQIFLFDQGPNLGINSSVICELGRLRELTFRAVGEGTQQLRDIDNYDKTYRHIVLWDQVAQEIVGAYRIGEAFDLVANSRASGPSALYTNELFNYGSGFDKIFPQAIELGRSFIQPKYWTKRGLDNLWQGIGAYLQEHPQVRYLFGAVSISNDYPDLAKQEIVALYQHFYQAENAQELAQARTPFLTNRAVLESYRDQSLNQAQKSLKRSLAKQNVTLPTLYKHYSDLCEPGGVTFIDFNIDPNFSFFIDGLILADLQQIKDNKRRRYLSPTAK